MIILHCIAVTRLTVLLLWTICKLCACWALCNSSKQLLPYNMELLMKNDTIPYSIASHSNYEIFKVHVVNIDLVFNIDFVIVPR